MKKYFVIFKGGKEQLVNAKNGKEAIEKVRKLLPSYEVVGWYESKVTKF